MTVNRPVQSTRPKRIVITSHKSKKKTTDKLHKALSRSLPMNTMDILCKAIQEKDFPTFSTSLYKCQNVDAPTRHNKKYTLLHQAAIHSEDDRVFQHLLDKKATVNIQDSGQNTPLHLASMFVNRVACKALLAAGADCSATNCDGKKPVYYCKSDSLRKQLDVKPKKIDTQAKMTLHVGVQFGSHKQVEALLRKNPKLVDEVKDDKYENSLLHTFAIHSKDPDIFSLLLMHQANVHATNADGDTPLHLAVKSANTTACIMLLNKGAEKLAENNAKETPLSLAQKDPQIAKILKETPPSKSTTKNRFVDLLED